MLLNLELDLHKISSKWSKIHQTSNIGDQFQKKIRVRKNLEVAVFERFRPLALQQQKPEVHPSNNFNFFPSKQQFVMLMARYCYTFERMDL